MLAHQINIPINVLTDDTRPPESLLRKLPEDVIINEFNEPDPFHEKYYPNILSAKIAISEALFMPLAKLSEEERSMIDHILEKTMKKSEVMDMVKDFFKKGRKLKIVEREKTNDT
jgi:hypothetical protein